MKEYVFDKIEDMIFYTTFKKIKKKMCLQTWQLIICSFCEFFSSKERNLFFN